MSFSFLHTAKSNEILFADALHGTGLSPQHHHVRADLLEKVTARGGLDDDLRKEIALALHSYSSDVDLLLLSCSSLSPVADLLKAEGVSVERTDRLLAQAIFSDAQASDGASRVAVLIAAPTTVEPTRAMFESCRADMGAQTVGCEIVVLPDVWDLFLSGNVEDYRAALTVALDRFLDAADDISHIALGQVSMAPALAYCSSSRTKAVWTIPDATRDFLSAEFR